MLGPASAYAQHWADFLRDRRWDLFGHFTFPHEVSERIAEVVWRKYVHKLNRFHYGVGYTKRRKQASIYAGTQIEIRWARAQEQQTRGAIHFHAVFAGVRKELNASVLQAAQAWRKLTGGDVHSVVVLPYDPTKGGIEYMCKKLDVDRRPLEVGGQF